MPFEPVQNQKIAARVVSQIEQLILFGVLSPGDALPPERDLADQLAVSRPTLRDALAELEERALITSHDKGRGYRVQALVTSAFSPQLLALFQRYPETFADYFQFRRDIEGLAVERAARFATAHDRELIQLAFDRMAPEASGSLEEEAEADAAFHMALVDACHNTVMIHMMRSIFDLLRSGVFQSLSELYRDQDQLRQIRDQHRAIMDAVLASDDRAARQALVDHIDFVEDWFEQAGRLRRLDAMALKRVEKAQTSPAPGPSQGRRNPKSGPARHD